MDFDTLAQWAQQLKKHKTVAWSQLPDIDLYMDQVITYLERQTALLRAQDQDKMMTPSLINNYAKNGILPRPQGKKYSREHLALLMAISMIKPIISMEEIERLLRFYRTKENVDGMFSQFCKTQDEVLLEQTDRFERSLQACTEAEDCEALIHLALQLVLEANARRIIAEKILSLLPKEGKETSKADKKADK